MPLFKRQRFYHSSEYKKHLREKGVGYADYRDGNRSGSYADIDENVHLHVKDGEIGPATNLFIVAALSTAGLLVLAFFVLPLF